MNEKSGTRHGIKVKIRTKIWKNLSRNRWKRAPKVKKSCASTQKKVWQLNSRETAFGNPDSAPGRVVRKRTDFSQPLLPATTALERNLITDCYEPTTQNGGAVTSQRASLTWRVFTCGLQYQLVLPSIWFTSFLEDLKGMVTQNGRGSRFEPGWGREFFKTKKVNFWKKKRLQMVI